MFATASLVPVCRLLRPCWLGNTHVHTSIQESKGSIFLCVAAKATFFQHNKNLLRKLRVRGVEWGGKVGKDGSVVRRLVPQIPLEWKL